MLLKEIMFQNCEYLWSCSVDVGRRSITDDLIIPFRDEGLDSAKNDTCFDRSLFRKTRIFETLLIYRIHMQLLTATFRIEVLKREPKWPVIYNIEMAKSK
jgi:hypothetical protein